MWIKGETLGAKHKAFSWMFDKRDGISIKRHFKRSTRIDDYTCKDIEQLLGYIKTQDTVPLGNSVVKLAKGIERRGLGSYVFDTIKPNTSFAQSTSQLAAVMVQANILAYNGVEKGMEFWFVEGNWQKKLESLQEKSVQEI